METTTPTWPVTNAADVNELAEELTACMQSAFEAAICTLSTSAPQGRYQPLLAQIANMIADKRHKWWQPIRCPTLKDQLNRIMD